ncbi:MAG: hypothetical protein J5856_01395 [Lachnospiraceae bacterium]|nr:hypothetical protein [Lachnospiraceae bacterium]
MESENSKTKKNTDLIYILTGCVLCVLSMLPFFIMGEKSIITYNDQLDGEMITYILNAKHLFEGLETYPELMNGIPAAGMTSPAPLYVILFRFFSPFACFMIMTASTRIAGFLSMYFLCGEFCPKKWIGFAVGTAFMMLPFYPVYGLSIPGQAFAWYALVVFTKEKSRMRHLLLAYALLVLYALTSSIALVGFGIIIAFGLYAAVIFFKSKLKALRVITGVILLTFTYALSNMPLLRQALGLGYKFVSNKSETVVTYRSFTEILNTYLLGGDPYTACFQKIIACFAVVSLVIAFVLRKEKKKFFCENKAIANTVLFIVSAVALIEVYCAPFTVDLRNRASGMFHDFNFIRIAWMLPVAWMLLLALCVNLLVETSKKKEKKILTVMAYVCSSAVIFVIFLTASFKNDVKTTTMRMIKGSEYKQISFGQFYSSELFDEAERIIGKPRKDFAVISMGLTPASAAYNGFNCLDAYSNNYDVEYKHEFRQIIEKELAKNDYYTSYFDDWGNRCYIYLASYRTGINADFYNITFSGTEVNYKKAKEMGADYVISASAIEDYDAQGLKLLNSEPIRSDDCWYVLYVYEIL